jgi:hypothetical protein
LEQTQARDQTRLSPLFRRRGSLARSWGSGGLLGLGDHPRHQHQIMSKLFLTIAAAFAEAERDRIRERISQVKADQKARGRYLGGTVPFGYRRGESGELVPHQAEQEAIREMVALRAQGKALRAIADAVKAKGVKISHEGVVGVLRARRGP